MHFFGVKFVDVKLKLKIVWICNVSVWKRDFVKMYNRKETKMDEEEGQGVRRPSTSFWDFSPLRALLSLRSSGPDTPPTPEIIVTACSSETIVSGMHTHPLSLSRSPSVSTNDVPLNVSNLAESKSVQLGHENDNCPLLELPSSPDASSISVSPASLQKLEEHKNTKDEDKSLEKETESKSSAPFASVGGILMNPLSLESMSKTTLRLPKTPFRKRSSSYSDLSSQPRRDSDSSGPGPDLLPELSATELRLILTKNLRKADKKQHPDKAKYISQLNEILSLGKFHRNAQSSGKGRNKSNSEELIDASSSSKTDAKKKLLSSALGLGAISSGLLPATSVASLIDNRILGVNNLQLPADVGGSTSSTTGEHNTSSLPRVRARPRLLSHPEFSLPDSIQTAPIASSPMRFFIPPYFRRPSQLSTVSSVLLQLTGHGADLFFVHFKPQLYNTNCFMKLFFFVFDFLFFVCMEPCWNTTIV